MKQVVLEVDKLTKRYDDFLAVDGISFRVHAGEIVGLLGPNGAGKTTTIQMLLDLTTATSGSISYFGKSLSTEREYILSRINFASAYAHMQGKASVEQNLRIFAGLYGVIDHQKRIDEVLALLEVEETKKQLFWKLSSGQKTRVVLAKSLLNKPQLILMDEPTASLDPEIANKVMELIENLQKIENVAILYTSHAMSEVERLCDRVIFLDRGKIVAEDTPLGLTKRAGKSRVIITYDGNKTPVTEYLKRKNFLYRPLRDHVVEVTVSEKDIPTVLFGLSNEGVWLTDIDIQKPNLEDVFLQVAKGARE